MLQVRKLVLAVAAATALTSGVAHAVGLGNVSVKSSLNQPLEAEIELLEVGDLTALELRSQLAAPEEFSRAGVDRQFFLTNLKFTPVIRPDGKSVVRITSERSVREPYLNFLVELLWPNGRVLREYTVLLDPPTYTPQEIVYIPAATTPDSQLKAATQTQAAAPVQKKTVVKSAPAAVRKTTPVASSQPSAATRQPLTVDDRQYRVEKNDTLWTIASRYSGTASMQQIMLAISDLNPDAFINGNINLLKTGQVLTLPNEEEIRKRSKTEAMAQYKQLQQQIEYKTSTAASENGNAAKQLDARHRTSAGTAPAKVEQQDTLRLVASETGETATGNERGEGKSTALSTQLSEAKEMLDSSRRENADLHSRVDELNEQIDRLNQLIELKNAQLANLQHLDATDEKATGEEAALTGDTLYQPERTTEQAQDFSQEQPDATFSTEETVSSSTTAGVAEVTEQPDAARSEQVKPETAEEPEVAQRTRDISRPEQTLTEELMGNPLFLPSVIGSGALLLLVLLLSRRKKAKASTLADNESDISEFKSTVVFNEEVDEGVIPEVEESFTGFQPQATAEDPALNMGMDEQSDNTIAEAENYIAYGNFNQAFDVLMQAIDKQPQRIDLRMKLLEVLADLNDKKGLSRQISELVEMGAPQVEAIKARYAHLIEVETAEADSVIDDFDLELDKLTMDNDLSFMEEEQAQPVEPEKSENEAELFDELAEILAESDEQAALAELDNLDLTLDEPVSEQPENKADIDEFDFTALDEELAEDVGTEQVSELDAVFDELLTEVEDEGKLEQDDSAELEFSFDEEIKDGKSADDIASLETAFAALGEGLEDDLSYLADTDEATTKLDLARAYIEMGDAEGARDILEEVVKEGNEKQRQEARELIDNLS